MSWRTVVITQRCKLDLKMGFMVIRTEEQKKIHLDDISVIIIENTAVTVTACLLVEIAKKKIKLIFCDEKRNPYTEMNSIYGSHDSSSKIKSQINWRNDIKSSVWTSIVKEKINKQAQVLYTLNKQAEADMLKKYISEMEINDLTNREGHAAKVYFNALFGKSFTRDTENSINAALNYGYSLLLSTINREVVSNGYLTQLGLFHDNMFNFFNLSCDIMEPFRAVVDIIVFNEHFTVFESEQKHRMVYCFMEKMLVIDDKKQYMANALKIYCKSIFDALNGNDVGLIKFYDFDKDI